MMHPHAALDHAQNLIRDPNHWGKGSYARDKDGAAVALDDPTACKFCSGGALAKALGLGLPDHFNTPAFHLLALAARELTLLDESTAADDGTIYHVNDLPSTTHDDVMRMFDRAKELAHAHAV